VAPPALDAAEGSTVGGGGGGGDGGGGEGREVHQLTLDLPPAVGGGSLVSRPGLDGLAAMEELAERYLAAWADAKSGRVEAVSPESQMQAPLQMAVPVATVDGAAAAHAKSVEVPPERSETDHAAFEAKAAALAAMASEDIAVAFGAPVPVGQGLPSGWPLPPPPPAAYEGASSLDGKGAVEFEAKATAVAAMAPEDIAVAFGPTVWQVAAPVIGTAMFSITLTVAV